MHSSSARPSIRTQLLFALVASVTTVGCIVEEASSHSDQSASASGSGGASSGGAGGGGGSVPSTGSTCTPVNLEPAVLEAGPRLDESAVAEVFQAIKGFLDARTPDPDPQADALALRELASTAPHVFDTGIGQDCAIWMRLTDGTPITLFDARESFEPGDPNPLEEPSEPEPLPPSSVDGPTELLDAQATSYALPESEKAFVAQAHNLAPHAVDSIEKALQKRGYDVKRSDSLKLADLRNMGKLGVLYLSTHGFTCHNNPKNKLGYCLVADDEIDFNTSKCIGPDCTQIGLDRDAGIVGYAVDKDAKKAYYALNDGFVKQYWSFAKNALVFLDSCQSMDDVAVETSTGPDGGVVTSTYAFAPLFRAALTEKGAGTLVGWYNLVTAGYAERTAALFFDRVLGANVIDKPVPPQRPFSAPEVHAALVTSGKAKDPNGNGHLGLRQTAADSVILAPSIRNMVIGDPTKPMTATEKLANTQLTLYGEFGTRAIEVDVGGTKVSPGAGSTSTRLVVTLPGPDAGGAIVVRVPTGASEIAGNAAPLTSWRGTCKWKTTFVKTLGGPPGIFNELDCSAVHLRGDAHPFRMAPDAEARPGIAHEDGEFFAQVPFPNSVSDTVCTSSVGGTASIPNAFDIVPEPKTVSPEWIANEAGSAPEAPAPYFFVTGMLDTSNPQALKFGIWPSNRITTGADFIYPDPIPKQHTDKFSTTMTSLDYIAKSFPVGAASYAFDKDFGSFTLPNGDTGEMKCTMTPDSGTAPTADTEG